MKPPTRIIIFLFFFLAILFYFPFTGCETKKTVSKTVSKRLVFNLALVPEEVLQSFSNNYDDTILNRLKKSLDHDSLSDTDFISKFYINFKTSHPDKKLADIITADPKHEIVSNTSDETVLKILRSRTKELCEQTSDILKKRLEVNFPDIIQVIPDGKRGWIKVFVSGPVDHDRIRRILQGPGKVDFFEAYIAYQIIPGLIAADSVLEASENRKKDTLKNEKITDYLPTVKKLFMNILRLQTNTSVRCSGC